MDKRRNYQFKEETLGDPLAEFSDISTFNILQFIQADNETPVDSPAANPAGQQAQMHAAARHPQQQQHVNDPHHNVAHYQTSRLPDSPPITDISGAASSGSPSSNSDTPYSPENYGNFGVHSLNNQGLILGVHELSNQMMLHPEHMQGHPSRQGLSSHILSPSPNTPMGNCFMSPYNNAPTPAQVSPPSNRGSESFPMVPGFGGVDLFNIMGGSSNGSLNSCDGDSTSSRKRPRLDTGVETKLFGLPDMSSNLSTIGYDENFASHQPAIKFSKFEEEKWLPLYDEQHNLLQQLQVCVVADKGFNYFSPDNCFVNQKKNHFQISVHIEAIDALPPRYVKRNNQLYPIDEFKLAFCGVKHELPTSEIQIKQSQTDRKPGPHSPVTLKIEARKMTKVTVPRLHFQETTMNNQRKNGRANPDQKYFLLVVRLIATSEDGQEHLIQSYHSERVIVRATNPGAFDPAEDVAWHRNGNVLYTQGPVAINTEMPIKDAKLSLAGDFYHAGRIIHPSDIRLKENITDLNPLDALENIRKLHIVKYMYKPEIAEKWGLSEESRKKTGLLAQELREVMPDAVHDIGDYLTVDENRVFYETLLATQELCRLTGDLDSKIDEKVDEISQRLTRYARRKKLTASIASGLSGDAFDTKSTMSYSRTSLASSYSTRDKKKGRCRTNCKRQDPLCHSRLTQGTIVTLVVVMAVCLLSMTSLYILDWHNRNFGGRGAAGFRPDNSTRVDIGNMALMLGQMELPIYQVDAPPLISHCQSENCHSYCCSDRNHYLMEPHGGKLDGHYEHKKLTARSAPGPDHGKGRSLGSGVYITLPTLNMTLDSRYCIESSCSKKHRRFNLFIPVSPYLPTTSVPLLFTVPNGKVVNNCGYLSSFANKQCSNDVDPNKQRQPSAAQLDEGLYDLSIGSYLQSAYRFRVGYTTESCSDRNDIFPGENVHLYEEYNLVFYRTCSPTSPDMDMNMDTKK